MDMESINLIYEKNKKLKKMDMEFLKKNWLKSLKRREDKCQPTDECNNNKVLAGNLIITK